MLRIDRRRVRDSFGRRAPEYEDHALVQKRVIARFLDKLENDRLAPHSFLDVGTGSGMLLRSLQALYRGTFAVGVDLSPGMSRVARQSVLTDTPVLTADAEYLPFSRGSFDLVVSTSTFQWLTNLSVAFDEVFRVLKPGGIFSFSLFGERTLHELRQCYRDALIAVGTSEDERTHTFFTHKDVATALQAARFVDCRIVQEQDIETHADVPDLLRSLKRIGAGNASPLTGGRGLAGRHVMLNMMERYRQQYGTGATIPATYDIIYAMAAKPFCS